MTALGKESRTNIYCNLPDFGGVKENGNSEGGNPWPK